MSAPLDLTPQIFTRSRLDDLPNEVLEMVMGFSDGLGSLHALVMADSRAKALFERRPHAMLISGMNCSTMEAQLKKMFCTIISIRQRRKYCGVNKSLRAYINTCLGDKSTAIELDLSCTPTLESIDLLNDAMNLYTSVTEAEISLIRTQLPKTAARIHSSVASDRFYRTIKYFPTLTLKFKKSSLSPTELHRIRRALWRLRLYYEAFYEPYLYSLQIPLNKPYPCPLPLSSELEDMNAAELYIVRLYSELLGLSEVWEASYEAKGNSRESQAGFFAQMTVWELEEMECVWYHLQYQQGIHSNSTLWRRRCPRCGEQFLPDDLLGHVRVRRCRYNVRHYHSLNFGNACSWYRLDLEYNFQGGTTADRLAWWPNPLAREPSAGFKFLFDHLDKLRPGEAPPTCARDALDRFLEWGYCIWDRERLEAWRLVDSAGGKVGAVYEWWAEERRRPGE